MFKFLLIVNMIFLLVIFFGFWVTLAITPNPTAGIILTLCLSIVCLLPNFFYFTNNLEMS